MRTLAKNYALTMMTKLIEKSDELAEDADMLSSLTQEYETVFTFCSYDNQNIFSKPHLGHL